MAEPAREVPPNLVVGEVDGHRIAANLMHFVRLLRKLGFKAGPEAAAEAAAALGMAGVSRRADFYWTLHALLVEREEQRPLFAQAFRLFWRNIDPLAEEMAPIAPQDGGRRPEAKRAFSRRVEEAWASQALHAPSSPRGIEADRAGTASAAETLAHKDFEQMSAEEWRAALRMIPLVMDSLEPRRTRRFRPASRGAFDLRATVRESLRTCGEVCTVRRRRPRLRPPCLVAVCDISGSMASYSRMFLHFMHAMKSGASVRGFVFGTRLTCVDRSLRRADPDAALEAAGAEVPDWAGGTRIAASLHAFNRDWARRTLAQGATVLLATDGLERGGSEESVRLEFEVERLAKSCRRLVWLNPLLRYDRYEALAAGARALARHASEVRPIHSLHSLAQLGAVLAKRLPGGHGFH